MSTTKTQVKDKKLPDLLALHGSLKITILRAKNLPLPYGSAPFVKIVVGQHQIRTTQARLLSDFKLTPGEATWNETFEFDLNNDTREVKVQLMDWAVSMSKNPVGTLRLSIGEFVSGSLAGILREKQILLQMGDGEDAALMGGTDRWFPSDRKPTLVDMTFNYEPAVSAALPATSEAPSFFSPTAGQSDRVHAPSPRLNPLGGHGDTREQQDYVHHSHRGAFVHCPLSNYKVFLPFRQPCSAQWHSRRKQEKKTGLLAVNRNEGGSGSLMKPLERANHVFAVPAMFLEMPDPLREFLITSLADWSLAERWNNLREFPVHGPSIKQGMGLNDLIPLYVEGDGDRLGEAASMALWGTQDKTREVEAGILYEIDKHGSAYFFNAWKQQQIKWLQAVQDPAVTEHTAAQWHDAWDRLMKEFSKGGRRKLTRNMLSLKLLLLAHATRRAIVVLHDEDYTRSIIQHMKVEEEAQEQSRLLLQGAKGRKAMALRAAKERREMTTEERARTADKVLIFQHVKDVGNVSSEGLGGIQMGQLSDVNLQGVYLPWHYPQFKKVHSPLVFMFCSKTGGFSPLVTQEGQHSDLDVAYPWPPLLTLSSRSGNTVLPVLYAGELPSRREVHDHKTQETFWIQPEEILLREWLICEEHEQTTQRIMVSSAATNMRRARRVRTLYAVIKEAQCSVEFWSALRKIVILADHYRYIATKQAANEMTGIEISDHMVDLHPFPVDEYFCREANSMEFAMLKKFAQTQKLENDEMMIQQRRRWMMEKGHTESKEKTEAAGLERHHFLLHLAGLGLRREDLDELGHKFLQGIESMRPDDWDGEEQQEPPRLDDSEEDNGRDHLDAGEPV